MELSKCTRCGETKSIALFSKDSRRKQGHGIWCKDCVTSYRKQHYLDNKSKINAQSKAYHESHKEETSARGKRRRFTQYGLTKEDFVSLLETQNYKCAVCEDGLSLEGKSTHIDHNHKTGEVRGILCPSCNLGIGKLKDNPDILDAAAAYLRKNGHYG